jgi:urease accessory protein
MAVSGASAMPDISNLLGALQHADSFFPSGAVSFSWGLETLFADRKVATPQQLAAFVEGQLRQRWATCDVCALTAVFRAQGNLDRVAAVDGIVEAMTLAPELRDGSRRAGTSLLNVHAKLDTPGAAEYRGRVRGGLACAHLPVVQGLVWRACGMTEETCRAISAHTLCTGLVGAALRLGMVGHLDAQKTLLKVRPVVAALLKLEPAANDAICAYTPEAEIASMRHEQQDSRLFAN